MAIPTTGADGSPRPAITVVIPTLGARPTLARVLDGYERQRVAPGRFEVVVVTDQAALDPAAVHAWVGERPYPVRVIEGTRPGASGSRNAGWRAARAELVLFTDDDTVPRRGLVEQHVRWHQRLPADEVAVLGLVRWARRLRVTPFMRWLDYGIQFDYHSIRGAEASWAHLYSANTSLKRRLLERVGGYDEERLPYLYEDLDLAYRMRAHGLRVMLNRRAVVDHWRTPTLVEWQERAALLAASEREFHRLHPEIAPWFRNAFAAAAAGPRARGRATRLAWIVPHRAPLVGPLVWTRADLYWRQQIAPFFESAWEGAGPN